jgi:hypothetical protein
MKNIIIKFKPLYSLHGSITHYYHFFYAVFIPLLYLYIQYSKKYDDITFIITNELGPMMRLITSLPLNIKIQNELKTDSVNKELYLLPMDIHPTHNKKDLLWVKKGYAQMLTKKIQKLVKKWFIENISKYDLYIKPKRNYDIVIIERKIDKKFHENISQNNSDLDKRFKTSGSERRSIENHSEMVQMIKNKYKHLKCINVSFEYLSIFEQFHLFNKAKLIIAQHGAALSNIIFMKKNSQLIEIINQVLLDQGENWFKPLSVISNIKHFQYITLNKNVNTFMDKDNVLLDLLDFEKFIDRHISQLFL